MIKLVNSIEISALSHFLSCQMSPLIGGNVIKNTKTMAKATLSMLSHSINALTVMSPAHRARNASPYPDHEKLNFVPFMMIMQVSCNQLLTR